MATSSAMALITGDTVSKDGVTYVIAENYDATIGPVGKIAAVQSIMPIPGGVLKLPGQLQAIEGNFSVMILGMDHDADPDTPLRSPFQGNTNITSLDLSELQQKKFPEAAFAECTNLTQVELPATTTEIADQMFQGCLKLTTCELQNLLNLTSIGIASFNNSGVPYFRIPYEVTSIGNDAFNGCPNLESIDFTASKITELPVQVCANCPKLTDVIMPPNITSIGDYAFFNSGITQINLLENSTLTSIGDFSFNKCTNLTHFDFQDATSLKTIGHMAFSESGLTEANLSNSITSIGEHAFSGNTSLSLIHIPENPQLTTIPDNFCAGSSLTNLVIPSQITSIGRWAFDGNKLESITFSPSDEPLTIGVAAFQSQNIKDIACWRTKVPTCPDEVFNDETYINGTLDVYDYHAREYISTDQAWRLFRRRISTSIDGVEAGQGVSYRYYNLGGIEFPGNDLPKGVYLRRGSNGTTTKVIIR